MINWDLYKGNKTEKSKKVYEEFYYLLKEEGYKILGEYKNVSTKVEVECDKGHRYSVVPSSFKSGSRCYICSNKIEESEEDFINGLNKINYKMIGKYRNSQNLVEVECDKGHRYKVVPNQFKNGSRCPHCGTISHGENLTKKILKEYNCKFETQKKFRGLVGLKGGQLSYDFIVNDKLLIEIQGKQHYVPVRMFGGLLQFRTQQKHDKLKREYAKKNGYELLEIPYFGLGDLDKLEQTLRKKLNKFLSDH